MEATYRQFRKDFPDIKAEWTFDKPYYKLLAGAYLYKVDCRPELEEVKELYPKAFNVQAEIPFEDILD